LNIYADVYMLRFIWLQMMVQKLRKIECCNWKMSGFIGIFFPF